MDNLIHNDSSLNVVQVSDQHLYKYSQSVSQISSKIELTIVPSLRETRSPGCDIKNGSSCYLIRRVYMQISWRWRRMWECYFYVFIRIQLFHFYRVFVPPSFNFITLDTRQGKSILRFTKAVYKLIIDKASSRPTSMVVPVIKFR